MDLRVLGNIYLYSLEPSNLHTSLLICQLFHLTYYIMHGTLEPLGVGPETIAVNLNLTPLSPQRTDAGEGHLRNSIYGPFSSKAALEAQPTISATQHDTSRSVYTARPTKAPSARTHDREASKLASLHGSNAPVLEPSPYIPLTSLTNLRVGASAVSLGSQSQGQNHQHPCPIAPLLGGASGPSESDTSSISKESISHTSFVSSR